MESDNLGKRRRGLKVPDNKMQPRGPKWLGVVALGVAFVLGGAFADAQQQAKIAKIGWLAVRSGVQRLP